MGKWPEASLLVTRATKDEIDMHEEQLKQDQRDSIDVRPPVPLTVDIELSNGCGLER